MPNEPLKVQGGALAWCATHAYGRWRLLGAGLMLTKAVPRDRKPCFPCQGQRRALRILCPDLQDQFEVLMPVSLGLQYMGVC